MANQKARARFCRHCGTPLSLNASFCRQCGRQISPPSPGAVSPPATGQPAVAPPVTAQSRGGRGRWTLVAGCVGVLTLVCVVGAVLAVILRSGSPSDQRPPSTAWDDAKTKVLHTERLVPSQEYQVVDVEGALSIVVPGGFLDAPQEVSVTAITGGQALQLPLPAQPLGTFEIKLGEKAFFADHLFIELPYDPAQLESPLPPEFSLVASYWDEGVAEWVEMPSVVDTDRRRLIIPTLHLTKIRYDYVVADGHIYNDYFSIKYDQSELDAMKKKYPNFEQTLSDYVEGVSNALEAARLTFDQHGFRELEKIKAAEWAIVPAESRGVKLPPWHPDHSVMVKTVRFNVFIGGDRHDESWTWKGIAYSNLSRSKYTGNIYIPYDHSGVQALEIAHEVFHSIQNRYYNLVGMTEFGVPGTTSPSYQFLARQWWLEATAEYAAGKLVHPEPDGRPNQYMGGDLDFKRHEKPLAHSPSVLRQYSERPAYNNAWFIEFLVTEQGIDFKDMFETVASYKWPSVYDNLVAYLETQGLDINQVYAQYTVWWLFSPRSPLQRGAQAGKVSAAALAESHLKAPGQDLKDWTFEGGAGPHRAKIWEIRVDETPQPALPPGSPRAIIVSLEQERTQELRVDPPVRRLWLIKWTPRGDTTLTAYHLTHEDPVRVETLQADEVLYLLAVRNDDLAGVLGEWYPEVRVTEAQLKIEPAGIADGSPDERQTFTATANNIPEALTQQLRFEWELDGRPYQSDPSDGPENVRGAVTASLKDQQFQTGAHTVLCKLYADSDILLAEDDVSVNMTDLAQLPTSTPESAESSPRWEKMAVSGTPGNGWDELSGILETVKGQYSTSIEGNTGIRPGHSSAYSWKAYVTFAGSIRSDQPVTVSRPEEMAAQKERQYQSQIAQPDINAHISSGDATLGALRGAYVVYAQEQHSSSGWGISYSWEYNSELASGNAYFYVTSYVSVGANRPEYNQEAKERFDQLVQEAQAAIAALRVELSD